MQLTKNLLMGIVLVAFLPHVTPCQPHPWDDSENKHLWRENDRLCGTTRNNGKVVGGSDVDEINDWPWLGFLRANGRVICTVELIAWQWATATAKCVADHDASTLTVTFGTRDITKGGITVPVQTHVTHPDYQGTPSSPGAIAVLHLGFSMFYSDSIRPVCLPDTNSRDYNQDNCWVAGWGHQETEGAISTILQELRSPIITNTVCENTYSTLDARQICATLNSNSGICYGDGGGPLMCKDTTTRWDLIGIVQALRLPCGKHPDMYTRVSQFSKWIIDVIDCHGGPKGDQRNHC